MQNSGLLTIADTINRQGAPNDTVLTLDWSPNVYAPAITWSVGSGGHIHSVWLDRVGAPSMVASRLLAAGDYSEAVYNRTGHAGAGSWLLVSSSGSHAGDIVRVDLSFTSVQLTSGRKASNVQWSPDAMNADYLDTLSSNMGTLHEVNTTTGVDQRIATGVTTEPQPAWSGNGQRLVYSTGMHVYIATTAAAGKVQQLALPGSASAFAWSTTSSQQLIVATNDGQPGIYLLNTDHNASIQLDRENMLGPVLWTQIP
jgi:hypothetical protein